MKVVHISTHDTGGAAVAAYRLHRGLLSHGVESSFLVLYNSGRYSDAITFKPVRFRFWLKKLKNLFFKADFSIKRMDHRIELFSSPDSYYDVMDEPRVREADIIHFHWISNFVDYESFFRNNRKPVFWTFHDRNPIQGGFHYDLDKQFAGERLIHCDQRLQNFKLKWLKRSPACTVISPSEWLKGEVVNSLFREVFRDIHVVPYGIDPNEFAILDRDKARKELGLTSRNALILVTATDLQNYRKGFDLVLESSRQLSSNDHPHFLLVGKLDHVPDLPNVTYLGYINDSYRLNLAYNAADATLLSSREDNLPNVMLESLMCGTPVIGFAIGGIKESVNPSVNGWLAEVISAEALATVITTFLKKKDGLDRDDIRREALRKFASSVQVEKVTKLYREVINKE